MSATSDSLINQLDFNFNDAAPQSAEQEARKLQQTWLQSYVTAMHLHVCSVHRTLQLFIFLHRVTNTFSLLECNALKAHSITIQVFLLFPNNSVDCIKPMNSKELEQPSSWWARLFFVCGVEHFFPTPIDHSKNTSVNAWCCSANCYKLDICHWPEHKQARRVNALIKDCSLKVFTDTQ